MPEAKNYPNDKKFIGPFNDFNDTSNKKKKGWTQIKLKAKAKSFHDIVFSQFCANQIVYEIVF